MIKFDNTYVKLPQQFYTKTFPVTVKAPQLFYFNFPLSATLGLNCDIYNAYELAAIFSGNIIPKGAEPLALVYAGHQFGHFVPQLGDGRAILLGEVINNNGKRYDIQLKGSGKTPYSRGGDGRATLGSTVREYIISEAMHALGIKTTRSLAIITTGETITRNTVHLPSAVLTRVAASHIRVGTFEYFAAQEDFHSVKILANYVINRHYPQAAESTNPYYSLLNHILNVKASLIVDWMRVGFIHGVMNTDNTTLSGETLDYGPCAFLDEYNANKVLSSIDCYGRYAFSNQANICLWNIIKLAQSLAPLACSKDMQYPDMISEIVTNFKQQYQLKYHAMMRKKVGIVNNMDDNDDKLIQELLDIMQNEEIDYTLTFRWLSHVIINSSYPFSSFFTPTANLKQWVIKWRHRLEQQDVIPQKLSEIMLKTNPAYIPRNHRVEEAIQYANNNNDCSKMDQLMQVLSTPYIEKAEYIEYMRAPTLEQRIYQTFCGT